MSPWLREFLAGAILKLFIVGAIGFVVGAVMFVVNGIAMTYDMTDETKNSIGGRGFPLFLRDDQLCSDQGRQARDRMQRWIAFLLACWLACAALLLIRFYGLHCAGWDCATPPP